MCFITKEMLVKLLLLVIGQQVAALNDYNDEDYFRFPDLHHMDRPDSCVGVNGGAYCVAEAELVPGLNKELYNNITKFSFSTIRHLDYRQIRYGYCITRRCKEFYTGESDSALAAALSACINSSLEKEYGLQAKLEEASCHRYGDQTPVTMLDRVAVAVLLCLVSLVVAGTVYDILATNKDPKGYLMCFSIPANWEKLTAPWPKDPVTARLIGVNGIRTINSIYVMVVHTTLPLPSSASNPIALEYSMESTTFRLVVNAQMIVQTFFVLSGFLLAYTTLVANEKKPMTLSSLPKTIFLRWLRLSPVLLAVLLFVLTWYKFVPRGFLWHELVGREIRHCQQGWHHMVFYSSNYVHGFQCQPHHWSTAVDFQLHLVGLVVLLLPATMQTGVVGLLVAIGAVLPALETYFRNLSGILASAKLLHLAGLVILLLLDTMHASIVGLLVVIGAVLPALETYFRNLSGILASAKHVQSTRMFEQDATFHYLYKPTHTNMPSYFIGMALGLFLHKWMKLSVDTRKYQKYACFYWLLVPVLFGVTYSFSFLDAEKQGESNLRQRLAFAMLPKVVWATAIAGIIFGTVCRVDKAYRRVLEWPVWVPLTRLTYCTYNIHIALIRGLYASDSQLTHVSDLHTIIKSTGIVVLTFLLALPLWLVVEAPSNNLVKKLFPEKKSILDINTTVEKSE